MRNALLILFVLLAGPRLAFAQQISPLQVDDVIDLLRLSGSQEAKVGLIRSSCVAFPLDAAATARLRTAGADEAMLEVIRTACFSGAELVVESQPSGIEVLVDNQRVGTTPWTGRFARGGTVQVMVRADGRGERTEARLEPGVRTRAAFALAEDTVPVPPAHSVMETARELNLEQRWQPLTSQPAQPQPPGGYGGFPALLVNVGAAAGGALYCAGAENGCWIEADFDDDGKDTMDPIRYLAGAVGGMLVGMAANSVIGMVVNSANRSSHQRAVARREEWSRTNQSARAEWMATHPELVQRRSTEQTARETAITRNAEIKRRNQALQPTQVTTEALPRPSV